VLFVIGTEIITISIIDYLSISFTCKLPEIILSSKLPDKYYKFINGIYEEGLNLNLCDLSVATDFNNQAAINYFFRSFSI
jgi:hypothetical protein